MNKFIDICFKITTMETKNNQTLTLEKSHIQKSNSTVAQPFQNLKSKLLLQTLSTLLVLVLWVSLCFKYNLFIKEALACSVIIGIIYFIKFIEKANSLK